MYSIYYETESDNHSEHASTGYVLCVLMFDHRKLMMCWEQITVISPVEWMNGRWSKEVTHKVLIIKQEN